MHASCPGALIMFHNYRYIRVYIRGPLMGMRLTTEADSKGAKHYHAPKCMPSMSAGGLW